MSKIPVIKGAIPKLKRVCAAYRDVAADVLNLSVDEALSALAPLFNQFKELTSLSWTQGTPAFNDGAPCVFSVYFESPVLVVTCEDGMTTERLSSFASGLDEFFNEDDSEIIDRTSAELRGSWNLPPDTCSSVEIDKVVDGLRTFCALPDTWFEYHFGNNVCVRVWRSAGGYLTTDTEYADVG